MNEESYYTKKYKIEFDIGVCKGSTKRSNALKTSFQASKNPLKIFQ